MREITTVSNDMFSDAEKYKLAARVANDLAKCDILPDAYKGKPANCLIALSVANEVQSSPLTVMQNLHIIKGKPSWSSTYVAASIRTKYKKVIVKLSGEGDERGCQVIAEDDNGNVIAEGARVTIGMAKAEGWYQKQGSKWKTMPDLMLQYRANAFFGRVYCPELLIGLKTEYENADIKDVTPEAVVIDPFENKENNENTEGVIDAELF